MSEKTSPDQPDIDKWFEELEEKLVEIKRDQPEMQKRSYSLDDKILDDFHGNAPIIDQSFKGQLPKISKKAQIFISENLQEGQYFRFGVEGGGCSGFNYLFDIDNNPNDDDVIFSDSPPAVIDSMSLNYLYGSEIDLEESNMNKMLKVTNPGAKASCGCGTSFAFDEDLLDLYD